ncbi:hypothetical protein BN946_scf184979.g61 [Trametes cinnabarina]|uniref:Enoyl reductase (ER) domain-containing protein n=1 Tax=Pycnoporus cinnabarinus TaxID=5643 RepID=A0A060SJY7_PYCCI|nr:hypothetical protein BN946_scf184979.g61 [Trametes cinnabarina]
MVAIKTQKALLLPAENGQYAVGEAPIPSPGPKEVLVKVISAALNPIDWKIAIPPFSGIIPEYPFITGTDGAGEVLEVGEEVTTLKKGDKIFFQGWFTNPYATFQQYCVVPAEITAKIPDNLTFDQAASVPLGLATVILALYNKHPNHPKTLGFKPVSGKLVPLRTRQENLCLSSAVPPPSGSTVAKFAGYSPIITTASPHNAAHLTSLGATHFLDRSLPNDQILAKLPELTGGKPIHLVYDAISLPETMPLAYQALAPGGALAIVLPDVIPGDLKKKEDNKRIAYVFGNVHAPENRACGVEMYKRLTEWLEKGIIKPNLVEVLPNGLAGAPEGLERLKNNKVSGKKLITKPQETP